MFGYMIDVIALAVVFSFFAFIFAFFAEGRGMHLMRIVLGLAPRKQGLEAFESVPRDDGDWRLIAPLAEQQRRVHAAPTGGDVPVGGSRRTGAPA